MKNSNDSHPLGRSDPLQCTDAKTPIDPDTGMATLALTPTDRLDIHAAMIKLRTVERNIVEALGTEILTLDQLAPKAGYEVNGHFKKAISSLRKRGILGNKRPGYFVQPQYQNIFEELSQIA